MSTNSDLNKLTDAISTLRDKPIQIINSNKNKRNYFAIITTSIAIISTTLVIIDRVQKPKVFGKIISITQWDSASSFIYRGYDNILRTIQGQRFLVKISLAVSKKDLYFKDANIVAIFNDNKRYRGEIYKAPHETIFSKGERYIVNIPPSEFLTYNSFIEKGKVLFFYLSFIIPNKNDKEVFKKLELELIRPNGKSPKTHLEVIDAKQVLFDEGLIQEEGKSTEK
ncbi:MAG: hypothetical protein HOP10_07780 [Chitinophagaceae bacterium]|nr:hypothetical protein [Chitinophagaceae bacterium]